MHAVSRVPAAYREAVRPIGSTQTDQGLDAPARRLAGTTNRGRHPEPTPGAVHNRPHTLRRSSQNGRCLPALRSGRECNGRSPPTPSRAWRNDAPDEGRCRADPHCTRDGGGRHCHTRITFRVVQQYPAASARVTRHEAISQHRAVKIDSKLMSYAQAEKVAQAGDVLQRRGRAAGGDVPQGRRLPQGARGRQHTARRLPAAAASAAAAAASQAQAAAGSPGSGGRSRGTGSGTGAAPLRPAPRPMPRAPTRPTGPASDSTSRVATTARATAGRTSSRTGRGRA